MAPPLDLSFPPPRVTLRTEGDGGIIAGFMVADGLGNPPSPHDCWSGATISWVEIECLWAGLGHADPADNVQLCLPSSWKIGTRQNYESYLPTLGVFHGTMAASETQELAEEILLLLFKLRYRSTTL